MNVPIESTGVRTSQSPALEASSISAEIRRAMGALVLLGVLCCGVYPIIVWAILQGAFPDAANGSLVLDERGRPRGSSRVGQSFRSPRYFHPRPSAAGASGYDATNSAGSNLGPTSAQLSELIRERVASYRFLNGLEASTLVPADAVMASGSGLDPLISPRNASLQARRVARERGIPEGAVRELIQFHLEDRQGWILGEPGVSVLRLNRALDALSK